MKQSTTYLRAVQNLNKMFDALNQEFCEGTMEKPTITIQSSKSTYASVSISKSVWKNSEGKETRELNISADYLMGDGIELEDTLAHLAHEMAHIWNLDRGIADVSANGYYHNKRFKKTAEEVFKLEIGHHPQYGWTITHPSCDYLDLIEKYRLQPMLITRDGGYTFTPTGTTKTGNKGTAGTPKKKSNSIKWICPVCGNIARTTKDMHLICGDCMETMIKA